MAKRRDYIPTKLPEFVDYQAMVCDQVIKHAKAWNIPKAEVETFKTQRATYELAYKKVKNRMTCSRLDIMDHDQQRKAYTRYVRSIVQRFLAPNPALDAGQRSVLGLAVRLERRKRLKANDDMAQCHPEAMGGTWVRFNCRMEGAGGRPKLHPECHAVEVEYRLLDTPEQPDLRYFEATGRHTSSKARFQMKLGRQGQYLHVRARWVNTSDPNLSGRWGTVRMVMIH